MAAACSSTRSIVGETTAPWRSIPPTTAPSGTHRNTTRQLAALIGRPESARLSSIAVEEETTEARSLQVGALDLHEPRYLVTAIPGLCSQFLSGFDTCNTRLRTSFERSLSVVCPSYR